MKLFYMTCVYYIVLTYFKMYLIKRLLVGRFIFYRTHSLFSIN